MRSALKALFESRVRYYCGAYSYSKELVANSSVKLHVDCPFHVNVRPSERDLLTIRLIGNGASVKCFGDGEITISGEGRSDDDAHCYIEAPARAGLNVSTTRGGGIDVKSFRGDDLQLRSETGDIVVEDCRSASASLYSTGGNLTSRGSLHAVTAKLETKNAGNVRVNKLLGGESLVKTERGNVTTGSVYCERSRFETVSGELELRNVHGECSVTGEKKVRLRMVGFDGTLTAIVASGSLDVQLSKLTGESLVRVGQAGKILLRLSEHVREKTRVTASSPLKFVGPMEYNGGGDFDSRLTIECGDSDVLLTESSWSDTVLGAFVTK